MKYSDSHYEYSTCNHLMCSSQIWHFAAWLQCSTCLRCRRNKLHSCSRFTQRFIYLLFQFLFFVNKSTSSSVLQCRLCPVSHLLISIFNPLFGFTVLWGIFCSPAHASIMGDWLLCKILKLTPRSHWQKRDHKGSILQDTRKRTALKLDLCFSLEDKAIRLQYCICHSNKIIKCSYHLIHEPPSELSNGCSCISNCFF